MNTNRSSINTYIYIFPHNLCKIQVFKLVFDSYTSINFITGSVNYMFGTAISRKHSSNNSYLILFLNKNNNF